MNACKKEILEAFTARESYSDVESGFTILADVYPVVVFPNFIEDFDDLLPTLGNELEDRMPFETRCNDLFRFSQTKDLLHSKFDPSGNVEQLICAVRNKVTSDDFISLVESFVKRPLSRKKIDFSAQKYCVDEYLLNHDDRLDNRRVAFVYYAHSPTHGGSLDFFPTDWAGCPLNGGNLQSFFPARPNTLVFFELSMSSHHQVSTVTKGTRISLAGWLHDSEQLEEPKIDISISCMDSQLSSDCFAEFYSDNILVKNAFSEGFLKLFDLKENEETIFNSSIETFYSVTYDKEPEWMKKLMSFSFLKSIESILNRDLEYILDWPSRPVAKYFYALSGSFRKPVLSSSREQPAKSNRRTMILWAVLDGFGVIPSNSILVFPEISRTLNICAIKRTQSTSIIEMEFEYSLHEHNSKDEFKA